MFAPFGSARDPWLCRNDLSGTEGSDSRCSTLAKPAYVQLVVIAGGRPEVSQLVKRVSLCITLEAHSWAHFGHTLL